MNLFELWLLWIHKLTELIYLVPYILVTYISYRIIKYFIRYFAQCLAHYQNELRNKDD